MADLRAAIAGLRAVRAKMTPGPWRAGSLGERSGFAAVFTGTPDGPGQTVAQWCLPDDAAGIVATHNAADALLDALDRIAAVVDRTDPSDGTDDYRALDEIRAILDGARGGDAP